MHTTSEKKGSFEMDDLGMTFVNNGPNSIVTMRILGKEKCTLMWVWSSIQELQEEFEVAKFPKYVVKVSCVFLALSGRFSSG